MGPTIRLYYSYEHTKTTVSNNGYISQQNAYPLKYNTNNKHTKDLGVKLCEEEIK